jgi:hypothetical protein
MDLEDECDSGAQSAPEDLLEEEELSCENDSPRTQMIKSNIRVVGGRGMGPVQGLECN